MTACSTVDSESIAAITNDRSCAVYRPQISDLNCPAGTSSLQLINCHCFAHYYC